MADRGRDAAPAPGAFRRNLLRLCIVAGVAWGLHLALVWTRAKADAGGGDWVMMPVMLFGLLLLYALLIALPFVPGVEIGLALMATEGSTIAPWIYLATLLGLALAFAAGAMLPDAALRRILADLRLDRASRLLERVEPLDLDARLSLLAVSVPGWLRPVARFRYLVLACLVNLPGNAVLGGGGGILTLAGFSRLFSPLATFATLALAVAPVPLLYWSFGLDAAGWLR